MHPPRCGIFPILPILPRPPYNPHPKPEQAEYPLVKAACHYTVVDVNVHARLTQTYVSKAKKAQEVKYIFPLPSNAAVCAFNAVIDDKRTIHGIVKQKDEAKRDYDKAVAEGKTAGLLDQHSADVFEVSLGNLKPDQKIEVNISYVSIISHDGKLDSLRLTLPLSIAPNYGTPPASLGQKLFSQIRGTSKPFELTVAFSMTSNISSITSQTHPIGLSLGTLSPDSEGAFDSTKAHVSLNTGDMLDKDVVIVLKSEKLDHPRCVVERSVRQDETSDAVALTLVPRFNLPPLPAQEYIFLIDRSGSMGGGRIAAVRAALQIMLRSLPARGSRVNLVSFGSHCDSLWPASVEYSAESVKEAAAHVDGMDANYGGTEIRAALKMAFDSRPKDKRTEPTMVLLLTDGEAWDIAGVIKETEDAVAESKGALRVFVLGVGDQVSTNMCDSIARAGRGVASYVGEQEKPDAKLMNMLKAARGGAVTDISVDWGVPVESEDAADDFEVVERDDSVNVDPAPAPPAKPISLFDTSSTPEPDTKLGPEEVPVNLPPVPRIQQSNTAKVGALYPGFRTSLFAIIRQPSPSAPTPTKVTVSGKVLGTPVTLEVPVTSATRIAVPAGEKPIDLLHVLAARAFVQALEDESNKTALVKAQITRLGTTYSITSSQTSFVAIDEKGEKIEQLPVVEQPEAPQANYRLASSAGPPMAMYAMASTGSVGGGGFRGPPVHLARSAVSPRFAAAPPPPPVMMAAPAAPAPTGGVAFGSAASAYGASSPPMMVKSKAARGGGLRKRLVMANPVADDDDDETASPTHSGPPTVEVLARQQQFDGSFVAAEDFYKSLGAAAAVPSSVSAISGLSDDVKANVWATIVAVAYMQKKFTDDEDSWALLADKARDYVLQVLASDAGVGDDKANTLVGEWIDAAKKVIA